MPLKSLCFLLLAGWFSAFPAQAQVDEVKVSSLSAVDRQFMGQQRDSIDSLARSHLGRQVNGDKENDLTVLQQLLDRRLVSAEQVLELQAMGVIMGDLLRDELKLSWVVYEDKLGRSRALRLGLTDHYLFPITMISRRAETGATVNVRAIYGKAVAAMQPHLPPRPFQ